MFSSEHHVGRLVEIRVASPLSTEELGELHVRHPQVIAGVGGPYAVMADLRRAQVFPMDIVGGFISMMTSLNPNLLRSGILINESAVFGLQVERAIREAGHPERKAFRDPAELVKWMAEILTTAELARLRTFLAEGEG